MSWCKHTNTFLSIITYFLHKRMDSVTNLHLYSQISDSRTYTFEQNIMTFYIKKLLECQTRQNVTYSLANYLFETCSISKSIQP